MQGENAKLKRYLLDEITPEERADIEMRIISDESFAEEVSLAESDLMEDYLENTLSNEETRLFHANFLTSPERENELKELELIKGYAKHVSFSPAETPETYTSNESRKEQSWFFLNWRPVMAVCAIVLIGLISFGVWRAFFNTQMSPLEAEYAVLNHRDLSDPAEISKYSSVPLIPGTLRDANGSAKLKAEGLGDSVLFRLALPGGVGDGALFDAKAARDGQKTFAVEKMRIYQNGAGAEIRLLLPKSVLTKGQFQIKLQDTAGKNTPIIYNFAVE